MESVAFNYDGATTLVATITGATVGQLYALVSDDPASSIDSATATSSTLVLTVTGIGGLSAGDTFDVWVNRGPALTLGSDYVGGTVFTFSGGTAEYSFAATWAYDGVGTVTVTFPTVVGVEYFAQIVDPTLGGSDSPSVIGDGTPKTLTIPDNGGTGPAQPATGNYFYAYLFSFSPGFVAWSNRLFDAGTAGAGFPGNPSTSTPDFSLSLSPSTLTIAEGDSATSALSAPATGGDTESIALSATGQPVGMTVSFVPSTIAAGGSSTVTVAVGGGVAPGTYPVTIHGVGSSNTHVTTLTVVVTPPSFTLAAAPSALTIVQGTSGSSTITATLTGGPDQTASLSATAPAGFIVSFTPPTIDENGGTAAAHIDVAITVTPGVYTVHVNGVDGVGTTATTPITVTVTAFVAPGGGGFSVHERVPFN